MNAPEPNGFSDPDAINPGETSQTTDNQRAIILHELIRVRREAEAARLEAQATRLDASAEQLQCLLRRLDAGESIPPAKLLEFGISDVKSLGSLSRTASASIASPELASDTSLGDPATFSTNAHEQDATSTPTGAVHSSDPQPDVPEEGLPRFNSWDAIRSAQQKSREFVRPDSPHPAVRAPRMLRRTEQDGSETPLETGTAPESINDGNRQHVNAPENSLDPDSKEIVDDRELLEPDPDPSSAEPALHPPPLTDVVLDENEAPPPRRRQSVAVIVSAVVHLVILICLAGFTLTSVMPKDQVALSASVSEASEEAMETFQIETVQPAEDPSETTPDETQYELDPLGEMAVVEVTPGIAATASTPPPSTQAFRRPTAASTASLKSLKSDSKSKMQFCGVEGGGNHFVYLVDSSGSMGEAFISARRALIESIGMLTESQRFYVIFFDAKCDFMRITRADQDEPRSVYATSENKQRLKSWAMRVEMDRGKAPYEPLEYALQKLKPDVIFLLSDGEFPQGIEDLLQEKNRVTNLFGDSNPVSIIHTISYHSREGESRMRRIAENNFGQYRHVPKP
ncbi:vWA domain-containing protein [Aporhodopirellula aestuarii]|uniref:VWFA domain-containing protein n=1 Tax=Aporhodopirellula aestuarii TaxID=2950107 RepID=A0ABT0U7Z2_9BACT|nr:hypothetical protein [Aporhodopirellula aestuarii]MCM2373055.1 hypothetical protein [Aporhodopirellula aestuarii]